MLTRIAHTGQVEVQGLRLDIILPPELLPTTVGMLHVIILAILLLEVAVLQVQEPPLTVIQEALGLAEITVQEEAIVGIPQEEVPAAAPIEVLEVVLEVQAEARTEVQEVVLEAQARAA